MQEDELLQCLRTAAHRTWPRYDEWYPPLDAFALDACEVDLGFALPPIVRRVYGVVGNGGFGPGYGGVLGLLDGATGDSSLDAVERYLAWRDDWQPDLADYELAPEDIVVPWVWPHGFLPVAHLGCAIYACLDCNCPEAPVFCFRHDQYRPTIAVDALSVPEGFSFTAWLEAWLDNTAFHGGTS